MIRDDCGFVYEWTNIVNGKKYIGLHLGDIKDNYMGSGLCLYAPLKNTESLILKEKLWLKIIK